MKPALFVLSSRLRRWQLFTLCLMVVGYSGYYLCRSNFSVLMPELIAEFSQNGADPSSIKMKLGLVASLGTMGYAFGKFFSGSLFDFLGGKRGFLGGMKGAIFFTLLCSFGGGMPFFSLAWIGNRVSQSMGWVGMVKLTSRWFPYSSYGTVMGFLSFSYLFGDAIARKFMSILLSYGMGWRSIFLTGALILALLCVINEIFLRETPADIGEEEPPADQDAVLSDDGNGQATKLRSLLASIFKSHMFWIACSLSLTCTFVRESFNTWMPTYFHEDLGLSSVQAAAQSAWFPLLGAISVLLFGFLNDYLGRNGRAMIIFMGLCLSGVAQLCLGRMEFASAYSPILLVALTAFLLMGPYSFLGGVLALDIGGKKGSATVCGFIDGIGYMGGYLSGITVAKISVIYGWNSVFDVLSFVTITASLISLFLLKRNKPPCEYLSLEKSYE